MEVGEKTSLEQLVHLNQAKRRNEYLPVYAAIAIFFISIIAWLYSDLLFLIPLGLFVSLIPLTILLIHKYRQTPLGVRLSPYGIEMHFKYRHQVFIPYDLIMDMCPADAETNWVAGLRIKKSKIPFFINKQIADAINEMYLSIFGKPIPYWDGIGRGFI